MVDLQAMGGHVAGLAKVGLGAFLGSLLLLTSAGAVLAAVSGYMLRGHGVYAWAAVVLALAEGVVLGVVFGGKRAMLSALADGLRRPELGQAGVRLVFRRVFEITSERPPGERGNALAQAVERLPVAQARERIDRAIEELAAPREGGGGIGGWFGRRLLRTVLRRVRTAVAGELPGCTGADGGVALRKLQENVERHVAATLAQKVARRSKQVLAFGMVVLVALAAAQVIVIHFGLAG